LLNTNGSSKQLTKSTKILQTKIRREEDKQLLGAFSQKQLKQAFNSPKTSKLMDSSETKDKDVSPLSMSLKK